MTSPPPHIVNTVIEFHGFIPVIPRRPGIKAVISSSFSRILTIRAVSRTHVSKISVKRLSLYIIEIIVRRKAQRHIIAFAQILHSSRLGIRKILTRHMVWHEINDNFHSSLMGTPKQSFKFFHTPLRLYGEIRIYIIIILDSIRRTGPAFNDRRMITTNAAS